MKPAPFRYFAPTTVDETLALLAEHGDAAKLLAGGQSLVPTMNFRLATPAILIDLNRVSELFYIRAFDGGLAIGAMTRQRQVERDALIAQRAPLIAETMPYVAHPQIRNRGTVGGSIAHADPAAELPAVAIALDMHFKVRDQQRERWVPAREFFIGLFATVLQPTEMLTEIAVPPMLPRTGWSFQEVARRHGDYALAGVASVVTLDENGKCQNARLVFMGLGGQPVDAQKAVQSLKGETPTPQVIQAAAQAVDTEIDPSGDIHASAAFRRHLAKVLAQRALETAVARAKDEAKSLGFKAESKG